MTEVFATEELAEEDAAIRELTQQWAAAEAWEKAWEKWTEIEWKEKKWKDGKAWKAWKK